MNKNRILNDNTNSNMYDNNNNNNRRVQFSMYAKNNVTSTTSIKSIPNANPLTEQESMPYRPELYQYSNSPPKLSHDLKSFEIINNRHINKNSNNSTPESILNEPIPSTNHHEYDSKSLNNLMNNSNSVLMNNSNSVLMNTQVSDDCDEKKTENNNSNNNNNNTCNKLPITNFKNTQLSSSIYHCNSIRTDANNHNSAEFDIFRQNTMPAHGSHGSYNRSADSLPGLYSCQSQLQTETETAVTTPSLPKAKSVAINNNNNNNNLQLENPKHLQFNTSIPTTQFKNNNVTSIAMQHKISLAKDFSNNKQAFETWMACCDIQDDTFGYYSALYPLLCEIFAANTRCLRVPKQSDLEEVILKHGAKKMKINKLHSHLSGTISSDVINKLDINNVSNIIRESETELQLSKTISFNFDNPNIKPKYLVTIKYKSFYKFWKWFEECCKIIKELSHLWDANNQSALQCNLFCGREESQQILQQAPQGTFMLRLSSVIKGGIVLSYCNDTFNKKNKKFKHTILIRRDINQYELRNKNKNNKKNKKTTSIDNLIRSFVKIKFLYTPHNLYPKKSIF